MIKSWQHKGLKSFYETGDKSGIIPEHAKRLKALLQLLNAANAPQRLNLPGLDFYPLKRNLSGFYSIAVRQIRKLFFNLKVKTRYWLII